MALATEKPSRAEAVRELFDLVPRLRRRFQGELPEDLSQELCRITPHQGETMYLLRQAGAGGVSMNELARAQGCALSTATAMVDRLLKLGLAERVHDEEDRRVVRITMTERGRALGQRFAGLKHRVFLDALERLDDDEVIRLVQLLRKVSGDVQASQEVQP
jgi:MarR family transcriptional regulator, organic hydroperoxide resistance regulator